MSGCSFGPGEVVGAMVLALREGWASHLVARRTPSAASGCAARMCALGLASSMTLELGGADTKVRLTAYGRTVREALLAAGVCPR